MPLPRRPAGECAHPLPVGRWGGEWDLPRPRHGLCRSVSVLGGVWASGSLGLPGRWQARMFRKTVSEEDCPEL